MNGMKQKAFFTGLLLLLLLGAAGWNLHSMYDQRERALRSADDLGESRQFAHEIEQLRARPQLAAEQDLGVRGFGAHIEDALSKAGLDRGVIEGVFPRQERQVGRSPYRRKGIALALRDLSLPQLVRFLHHLTDSSTLHLRDMQLRSSSRNAGRTTWIAEATVTYLIYAGDEER